MFSTKKLIFLNLVKIYNKEIRGKKIAVYLSNKSLPL